MILNHIILAMLWIGYGVLHSVLADINVKKRLQAGMGRSAKYYRLWYSIISFLLLAGLLYFQMNMQTIELFQLNGTILISGLLISFAGLSLMLVCINKYFARLSGLRSLYSERGSNQLMVTGVHKYVRHPLYLGTFVFAWGLLLILPYLSLLIANTIITVYTLIGIGLEEKKLVAEFGHDYEEYREKIPRLIPFLKRKKRVLKELTAKNTVSPI